MKTVTFTGPQDAMRLRASGRVLRRGVPTEVTNDEADRLENRPDVTVDPVPGAGPDED